MQKRIIVVSTHYGMYEWAVREGYNQEFIEVLDSVPDDLEEGDVVIGSLSPLVASELSGMGIDVYVLVFDNNYRFKKRHGFLSFDDLDRFNINSIRVEVFSEQYADIDYDGKIIVITRHRSIIEWLKQRKVKFEKIFTNFNKNLLCHIKTGTVVIGVLPVHLIHEINIRGGKFFAVEYKNMPKTLRHKELTLEQMIRCKPKLTSYKVFKK